MTERRKKIFLKHYSDDMNISMACEKANINRSTYYSWTKKDKSFNDAIQNIKSSLFDIAESVLFRAMRENKEGTNIPTSNAIKVAIIMHKGLSIQEDDNNEDDGYEIIED